jgi:hypothetical protein
MRVEVESDIEGDCRKFAIAHGWLFWKFVSPGLRGVPDRFMARNGRVVFVEFKRIGEEPNQQQLNRHKELRAAGVEVAWFFRREDFYAFAA